jgi:hypothetical protein
MTIAQTYRKLLDAYTQENLHTITTKIIDLYKNKQYHAIHVALNAVAGGEGADEKQESKAFYTLMMIYHPDRLAHYRSEIERHYRAKDAEQLGRFTHIFSMLDLEKTLIVLKNRPGPADTADEYRRETSGFDDMDFDDDDDRSMGDEIEDEFETISYGSDFFSVLKRSIYGHENIDLPYYYLEDLESLDLAGYGVETLDGIQHCVHVTVLDLSNNEIIDIAELSQLPFLQELFLSDNLIGYIDSLSFAKDLRILDLSNNKVDDISPLFTLDRLEYVNILGNPVPDQQIRFLRSRGIVIVV